MPLFEHDRTGGAGDGTVCDLETEPQRDLLSVTGARRSVDWVSAALFCAMLGS
jgi:hypothetical protein